MNPDINFRVHTNHEIFDEKALTNVGCHDLIFIPEFSGYRQDFSLYKLLAEELESVNEEKSIFLRWHDNKHIIANDKMQWKDECPTFQKLISNISEVFDIEVNATRLNLYKTNERSSEHKPYHHDRAAFTPGTTQNMTIAISLGITRTVSLKRVKWKKQKHPDGKWERTNHGAVINFRCPNNSLYAFSRDVNIEWQHALLPSYGEQDVNGGDRISIIVWGTKKDMNVHGSRVSYEQTPTAKELGPGVRNHRWKRAGQKHQNQNQ